MTGSNLRPGGFAVRWIGSCAHREVCTRLARRGTWPSQPGDGFLLVCSRLKSCLDACLASFRTPVRDTSASRHLRRSLRLCTPSAGYYCAACLVPACGIVRCSSTCVASDCSPLRHETTPRAAQLCTSPRRRGWKSSLTFIGTSTHATMHPV